MSFFPFLLWVGTVDYSMPVTRWPGLISPSGHDIYACKTLKELPGTLCGALYSALSAVL